MLLEGKGSRVQNGTLDSLGNTGWFCGAAVQAQGTTAETHTLHTDARTCIHMLPCPRSSFRFRLFTAQP